MPLGPLKRRDDEPVFDEPWQAQALGMADMLVTAGVISADAWATALGTELRKGAEAGVADDAEAYYRAVLAALQALLYEAGATSREEVDVCEEEPISIRPMASRSNEARRARTTAIFPTSTTEPAPATLVRP